MKTNCTYDKHQNEFLVELDGAVYSMTPGEFDAFARQQFEAEREHEALRNQPRDGMDAYHERMEERTCWA